MNTVNEEHQKLEEEHQNLLIKNQNDQDNIAKLLQNERKRIEDQYLALKKKLQKVQQEKEDQAIKMEDQMKQYLIIKHQFDEMRINNMELVTSNKEMQSQFDFLKENEERMAVELGDYKKQSE